MAREYREIKTVTGDFMRVNIFPVRPYQYGRGKKRKPTAAAMRRLNGERRVRLLSDIIALNFDKNDIQLKLDYSLFKKRNGGNPTSEEVIGSMRNFIRRLRRLYASFGLSLKYVYCSETGVRGNISHHHLIVNSGVPFDRIRALWHDGGVWQRKLYFDRKGCYSLADYFVKNRYTYRSFTTSKNLIRPCETGKDRCIFKNDVRIKQKHVNFFIGGDVAEILRLYPDWNLASLPEIAYTVDENTGELKFPTWGVFITLYLYKPEGISDPFERRGYYVKTSEDRI